MAISAASPRAPRGARKGGKPGRRGAKARVVVALAALLPAAFAIGAASGSVATVPALLVTDARGGELALYPLEDGRFVHHYVHSVHLRPVDEYFEVEGGKLRVYELRYDTNSVGMPDDAGGGFRIEGGRYVLALERDFASIPIMVSIVPGHGVVVGGVLREFADLAPERSTVVLSAATVSILSPRRFP